MTHAHPEKLGVDLGHHPNLMPGLIPIGMLHGIDERLVDAELDLRELDLAPTQTVATRPHMRRRLVNHIEPTLENPGIGRDRPDYTGSIRNRPRVHPASLVIATPAAH